MMEIFGATLHSSPSDLTEAGRALLAENPDHPGSLGIAISEAVEVAAADPDDPLRPRQRAQPRAAAPDGDRRGGAAPVREGRRDARPDRRLHRRRVQLRRARLPVPAREAGRPDRPDDPRVEPAACPSLTKGVYAYDFGDTAGMTPLMKMHTLGHDFIPDPIHAGGLRYHGMSPLLSHIYELGLVEAVAITQRECFAAALQFARTEGIVPAPEPTHALAACIREALRVQGDRRVEGDPHRAVRARPPRPRRLRARTSPARWSTTSCPTRRSRRRWPRCRCSPELDRARTSKQPRTHRLT